MKNLPRVFAATLSFGLIYQFLLVAFGTGTLLQLSVVIFVLFYAYAVYQQEPSRRTHDAIDSVYYMGFLFTVASLLFSLVPITWDEKNLDANSVLSAFAVALSTTMIGIVSKLILGQMDGASSTDLSSYLSRLSDAVNSASSSLEVSSQDMSKFHKNLINEHEEINQQLITLTKSSLNEISRTVDTAIKKIEAETEAELNNRLNSIKVVIRTVNKSLSGSYSSLNKSMDKYEERFDQFERNVGSISEDIAKTGEILIVSAQQYSAAINSMVENTSEALSGSIEKNNEAFKDSTLNYSAAVNTLCGDVATVNGGIRSFRGEVEQAEAALKHLPKDIKTITDLLYRHQQVTEKFNDQLTEFSKLDGTEFKSQVEGIVTDLRTRMQEANEVYSELQKIVTASSKIIMKNLTPKGY